MEVGRFESLADGCHVDVGHFDAVRVGGFVEFGVNAQTGACGGRPDQADDDLSAGEWLASPVGGGFGGSWLHPTRSGVSNVEAELEAWTYAVDGEA